MNLVQAKDIELAAFNNFDNLIGDAKSIGIAVSGGGDSMALFHLCLEWALPQGKSIFVATVDHKLRETAADEIAFVSKTAEASGVPFEKLEWCDWDGSGNLQAQARDARRDLLSSWAEKNKLDLVLLGHTRDDLAETFLMRLARGSGVDGLSAMSEAFFVNQTKFIRPLLNISRAGLRTYLGDKGLTWKEDPSNEDENFDRIRIRKAKPTLDALGLTDAKLADAAQAQARARHALNQQMKEWLEKCATAHALGYVTLDRKIFFGASIETQLRMMTHVFNWITGNPYRPRLNTLKAVRDDLGNGKNGTLHGCQIISGKNSLLICRESKAAANDHLGQWAMDPPAATVIFSQNHLKLLENWRDYAPRQEVLLSLPTILAKDGTALEPYIDGQWGQIFTLRRPAHEFLTTIVTH